MLPPGTSERRFYQKITDIYATSVDWDPTLEISIDFFKTVQNKMHWAITAMTTAVIIHDRVDSKKAHMGLTSWRGAKVRKQDVAIAKNYLAEKELLVLNNPVEQYLISAEGRAMRRLPMHMAKEVAETEYEKFNQHRIRENDRLESDFDKTVTQLTDGKRSKKK